MKSRTSILLAIVAVVLTAAYASAGVQTRTVATTVHLAASPEQALRAFIDAGDLEGWWKVSRSLVEPEPGGVWSVTWDDYGEAKTQHSWVGVVEEVGPRYMTIGHLVMIEPDRPLFGPLQLEIVAEPADGGTSLTVYHRGYRSGEQWDWMHDTVVAGWRHVLGDMQQWFLQEARE